MQQISSNSLHFLFICLMVLSHLSDHMNKIAQKLDLLRAEQEAITSMLADWGCWQGRVHIKDFPMLSQGTLLKLGHALHETPFSNWNHEKKMVVQCGFYSKPGEALWFSQVLTWSQRELVVFGGILFCVSCSTWFCFPILKSGVQMKGAKWIKWSWNKIWCIWRQH